VIRTAPFAVTGRYCLMLVAALAAASNSATARADAPEQRCAAVPMTVEGQLDSLWIDALARACAQLGARSDVDHGARLSVHAFGDELVIEATLADGRSAVREVASPLALARVLEALLALPSAGPRPNTDSPAAELRATDASIPRTVGSAPDAPSARASAVESEPSRALVARPGDTLQAREPRVLVLRAGVALMGRVTEGSRLSIGVQAQGGISVGAGELAVVARWEPAMQVPGGAPAGFESTAFGVGVLVGALTRPAPWAELHAGVDVTIIERVESAEEGADEIAGSHTDVRIGAMTRLELGSSRVRPFVGLDAEISPLVAGRSVRIDPMLPPQTVWSAGVTLGLAWTDI